MPKVIKSVLIGAALGAFIIGTGGLGAGLLSSVAAGLGSAAASIGIGLTATIAGALAGGLLGAAFSVIGGLLAPSSPEVSQDATGRKEVFAATAQPKQLVYGETRIGGQEIFAHTWGAENVNISIVRVVADREIEGYGDFYLGEDIISFDGNGDAIGTLAGFLSIRLYTGDPSQVADADLITNTGGKWTSAYVGNDTAYYILEAVFDQEKYPYGLGELRRSSIVVQGHKLYDPRLDSTVPGGSGSHRENDSTTWEYSTNSALAAYDYLRDVQLGCNIPDSEINVAQIIAAANSCDEAVNVVGGGTIPRYTANGTCPSVQTRQSNLDRILTSMGARRVYQSGQFYLYPAVADASSISLGEDDILSISLHPNHPLGERFNTVQGVFINPDNLYEATNYPALQNTAYKTEDAGETLVLDLSLPFTNDHRTAQRLSKIYLERSRQQKLEVVTKPKALAAFAWSIFDVTWDNLSLSASDFRATGYEINMPTNEGDPLTVSLSGVGEPSSVFDWDYTTEEQSLTSPGSIDVGTGRETWTPTGVTIVEVEVRTAGGRLVPALRVSWDQPPQNVARIIVQYRKVGTVNWITAPTSDINTTYTDLVGLEEATDYDVRVAAYMVNYIISPFVQPSSTTTSAEVDSDSQQLTADRNNLWGFGPSAQGWTGTNITLTHDSTDKSILLTNATSANPHITGPGSMTIDGDAERIVRIRIRRTDDSGKPAGVPTLFYQTAGHGFVSTHRKELAQRTWVQDRYVGLKFDMSNLTAGGDDWITSTILNLQFHPCDDATPEWEIDGIIAAHYDVGDLTDYDDPGIDNTQQDWQDITGTGIPDDNATENTGDLADLDQVDTPEIVDLAVTEIATVEDTTDQDFTAETSVLEFTVIKDQGSSIPLIIIIISTVVGISGECRYVTRLQRDTTGGGSWSTLRGWNTDTISTKFLTYTFPDEIGGLAADTHEFRIAMERVTGSGTVGKRDCAVVVSEYKK